jgi:predicted NBD/HSP70 family sugar kinase
VAIPRLVKLADRPVDPRLMSGINAMTLLELLRVHGEQSRSDLARHSGLSKPTTSVQVARLIELGIVVEAGSGVVGRQGGKTPILLQLNREFGRVLAVQVRANGMRFHLVGMEGTLAEDRFVPARGRLDQAAVTRDLTEGIASLLENSTAPLRVICLAVPGIVDSNAGIVLETDNLLGWRNLELRKQLSLEFGVPVVVENDVNMAALAEKENAGWDEEDTSIYVELDSGIGAGIVANGRLHRGAHWAAGEIAHLAIEAGRPAMSKPQIRGQLESVVGIDAITERLNEIAGRSPGLAALLSELEPLEALSEAARRGDTHAEDYAGELAALLAMALANLAACHDPRCIVLQGAAFAALLARIRPLFEGIFRWPVELRMARTGEDAALLGAFLMGLEKIFEECALEAEPNGKHRLSNLGRARAEGRTPSLSTRLRNAV